MSADDAAAPLQVVRGTPDEVELAALVAGIMAAASAASEHAPHAPATAAGDAWSDRRRQLRPAPGPTPGPDAWRWSLRG